MKTTILTLIVISSIVLFTNCNSDDSRTHTETFNGIWNLKNVRGGFQVINIDYTRGEVEWNFNLENNTLTVKNNISTTGPEDIYAGLDSGSYNIAIEQTGKIQTLFIDDEKRGVIVLLNTNLEIDDGFGGDGFIREFER